MVRACQKMQNCPVWKSPPQVTQKWTDLGRVHRHSASSSGDCRKDRIFDVFVGSFVIIKTFQLLFGIFLIVAGWKLVCALVQCPHLPVTWLCMEHPHAGRTGSWLIHKRDTSQCIGLVAASPTLHKWWRRSLMTHPRPSTHARWRLHVLPSQQRPEDVLFWMAQHELSLWRSHSQVNDILHNWHVDSSSGSIFHLNRERTAPRDLEPNLSQMSHSFWLHFEACDFHLQSTQKACGFWHNELGHICTWVPWSWHGGIVSDAVTSGSLINQANASFCCSIGGAVEACLFCEAGGWGPGEQTVLWWSQGKSVGQAGQRQSMHWTWSCPMVWTGNCNIQLFGVTENARPVKLDLHLPNKVNQTKRSKSWISSADEWQNQLTGLWSIKLNVHCHKQKKNIHICCCDCAWLALVAPWPRWTAFAAAWDGNWKEAQTSQGLGLKLALQVKCNCSKEEFVNQKRVRTLVNELDNSENPCNSLLKTQWPTLSLSIRSIECQKPHDTICPRPLLHGSWWQVSLFWASWVDCSLHLGILFGTT